jgi:hypothetical protein
MPMHFNKIKFGFIFFVFLGLMFYSLSSLTTKTVYAYDYLVNYNNNYNIYTSANTPPDKESALQNIDCVVNFMQSYVFTSSSVPSSNTCDKDRLTTTTPSDGDIIEYQSDQGQHLSPIDNTQQTSQQDTGVGIVKVISPNNINEPLASYSHPSHSTPTVTYQGNIQNENSDGNDNGNDEKKEYNENTVTKDERKILLKACFERAEDKGNYISSEEMKKCAENYNSLL